MSISHRDEYAFHGMTNRLAVSVLAGGLADNAMSIQFAQMLRDLSDDSLDKYQRIVAQAFKSERLRRTISPHSAIAASSDAAVPAAGPTVPPAQSSAADFNHAERAA